MPYVPPKRPTTAPSPTASPSQPTSTTTPTFGKSVFESTTKADLYSPLSRTAPTTPPSEAPPQHPADLLPRRSLRGLGDTGGDDRPNGTASTSSSFSKRKPVPAHLSLPLRNVDSEKDAVPASHPFARSTTSFKSGTTPRDELCDPVSPVSPRYSGPVPPRRHGSHGRNISLTRWDSPTSPADSELDRPNLFWRPPVQSEQANTGDEMEVLQGEPDEGKGPETAEGSQAAGVGEELPTAGSKPSTPSRRSSVHQHGAVGASEVHSSSRPESVVDGPRPSAEATTTSGHALRMRVDKSLPALPLDADHEHAQRPLHVRHQPMASTSSGPSTQIVTPRSASRPFASRSPEEDGTEEEGHKHRWYKPKRLGVLNRAKKDRENGDSLTNGLDGKHESDGPKVNLARRVSLLPLGEPEEDETFSVDRIPSKRRLWEAGTLFLRDENGELVCFGDMFPKMPEPVRQGQPIPPIPKTAVFFIRHFWCGQCQDYMFASLSQLDPEALEKEGVKVVIISNGSWKIIKSYKKLFNCPFPIYVDGPRKLYQLMGMTKMTNDFGPLFKGRAAYHQRNVPRQLLHGGKNALTKMPMACPGKLTQLGGEFVFSPGYNCDFAHRMTTTSDHMEAPDVLRQAGCPHPTKSEVQEITIAAHQKAEFKRMEKEMREWRTQREAELERIRRRRAERRGETYIPTGNSSLTGLGLDAEDSATPPTRTTVAVPLERSDSDSSAGEFVTPTGDPNGSSEKVNGQNNDGADTDAPACLAGEGFEDVLAWEPDERDDSEANLGEMNDKYETYLENGGIDVGLGHPKSLPVGDTFGRKGSGAGNGLEVITED